MQLTAKSARQSQCCCFLRRCYWNKKQVAVSVH